MSSASSRSRHVYAAVLVWEGDPAEGTTSYATYSRRYRVKIDGKPEIIGTADPAFRGEKDKHNPEDLFLAAISGCHMLSYLALCARKGVRVIGYEDRATGTLALQPGGSGKFEEVRLHPRVTIADVKDTELAVQLHDAAHELCFIANSCSVPIRHEASVQAR